MRKSAAELELEEEEANFLATVNAEVGDPEEEFDEEPSDAVAFLASLPGNEPLG